MSKQIDADGLRSPECVGNPDPRQEAFVVLGEECGGYRRLELADYHTAAASLALSDSVPEKIRTQFTTALNLYLYGWFVYRFLPVAEHQALTCLEYALRERYEAEIPEDYVRKGRKATLQPLVRYGVDKGDIRNEGFTVWHEQARVRSRTRHIMDKVREIDERGLDEIEVNEDEAEILDEDRDWAYVDVLAESLPAIRNTYAHGHPTLHGGVLGTMRIVAECVNQIY